MDMQYSIIWLTTFKRGKQKVRKIKKRSGDPADWDPNHPVQQTYEEPFFFLGENDELIMLSAGKQKYSVLKNIQ